MAKICKLKNVGMLYESSKYGYNFLCEYINKFYFVENIPFSSCKVRLLKWFFSLHSMNKHVTVYYIIYIIL